MSTAIPVLAWEWHGLTPTILSDTLRSTTDATLCCGWQPLECVQQSAPALYQAVIAGINARKWGLQELGDDEDDDENRPEP